MKAVVPGSSCKFGNGDYPIEVDSSTLSRRSAYHLTRTLLVPGSEPMPVRTVMPASLAILSIQN